MSERRFQFVEEFSQYPGGRYRADGDFSGEEFLEAVLLPLREQAGKTVLDLTGAEGFPPSFLDGAFGEYAARHGAQDFEEHFEVYVGDDPDLPREIDECLGRGDGERE